MCNVTVRVREVSLILVRAILGLTTSYTLRRLEILHMLQVFYKDSDTWICFLGMRLLSITLEHIAEREHLLAYLEES